MIKKSTAPRQRIGARPVITTAFGWFFLFLACSLLVFVVFSHYYPIYRGQVDGIGRIVTTLVFLSAALIARRSSRYQKTWPVWFAFSTACAAISLDYSLGLSKWILPALGIAGESPAGWAIDKLESSLLGIGVVILMTLASGQSLSSLYLRRGNLRLGLAVGLGAFLIVALTAIPVTTWFFNGQDLRWERILPWTPWVLVFVLANAFNEELLFRGLFFGRLEPFLGKLATNLLMAVPFTLMHTGVDYTASLPVFIAQVFPLSLAWGWLLQKTNSLWGSILFHAAMDIFVVLGIFSGL